MYSYGISSGKISASMLMESDLAFDVGAAASKILSSAIYANKLSHTVNVSIGIHLIITYIPQIIPR